MNQDPNTPKPVKQMSEEEIINHIESKTKKHIETKKKEMEEFVQSKIKEIDDKKQEIDKYWKGSQDSSGNPIIGMEKYMDNKKNEIDEYWEGKKDEEGVRKGGKQEYINNQHNKINEFWEGKEEEEGNKTGGMEEYMNNKKNEIDEFLEGKEDENGIIEEGMKKTMKGLKDRIEELLEGAIRASLASAYGKKARRHRMLAIIYTILFVVIILAFFSLAIAVIIFAEADGKIYGTSIFAILAPMTTAGILLCLFFSNKQREERRIEEEYSHKEMITTVFEAYKREVEKLGEGEDTKKLMLTIYENIIKSADYNPSRYIGKYDTPHPLFGIFKPKQENNKNITDDIKKNITD